MNPQFLKGVKTFTTATKALEKALTEGQQLVSKYTFEKLEELGEQISQKQRELDSLSQEFAEKKRQEEVSLNLHVQ